jgi:hypothetical protein
MNLGAKIREGSNPKAPKLEEIHTIDLGRNITVGSSHVKKGKNSGEGRKPRSSEV